VAVEIDKAGQNIMPFKLQHLVIGSHLRTPLGVDGRAGGADTADRDDPVTLDNDVHRPPRRSAGAVDKSHSSEDEALEGSLAFGPRWSLGGLLALGRHCRQWYQQDCKNGQSECEMSFGHFPSSEAAGTPAFGRARIRLKA
jgi:hypothetical protein